MTAHLLAALLAGGSWGTATPPSPPTTPYESPGVCPGECCTYRTWSVLEDTDILADRRAGAGVAFRVRRGTKVRGLTGVVVTTRLGRAVAHRPTALGGLQIRPGEDIKVLYYVCLLYTSPSPRDS